MKIYAYNRMYNFFFKNYTIKCCYREFRPKFIVAVTVKLYIGCAYNFKAAEYGWLGWKLINSLEGGLRSLIF